MEQRLLGGTMKLDIIVPSEKHAEPISALIVALMDAFLEPGADPSVFLDTISTEAEARYLRDPRYWFRIALLDGVFAGVIALRDRCHLVHLFISPQVQRSGIGTALWQAALTQFIEWQTPRVTVNAAPLAVPFYERLGFRSTHPMKSEHGVRICPMALELTSERKVQK